MSESKLYSDLSLKRTRSAYMWTCLLDTPMWAIFNMLPYILYKDLHATLLQITMVITLKPLVSLISLYWCAPVNKRRDRLLPNVIWARILSLLPFFLFPFIDNIWFFIATFGLYMTLARGAVPAWMEILKLNLPRTSHERVYATGSFIGYIGNIILALLLGWALDGYHQAWRWLFPLTASISFCATFVKAKIPSFSDEASKIEDTDQISFVQQLIFPWKNAWELLKRRHDFLKFQWGFILGGTGIMIMQPALPKYFVDTLNLSYTEMAMAISFCKGIGFALTIPLWLRFFNKIDIFLFAALPPLCICLFATCLLSAQFHIAWLFIGYLCYGMMQAGSEMCWNLSGPHFAKHEDSSAYSSVNLLMQGLRGCVIPPLGSLLATGIGAPFVIGLGGFFCLLSNLRFWSYSKDNKASEAQTRI